jgi:sulfatase maturation enzyme AslB (radical SAM superfamily)
MDLTPFKNCLAHTNSIYISNESEPYKPCCWFKAGIAADTVSEYREKLSKLDIATNCAHCIKQESSGATWSHRHLFDNPREFVLGVCFDNVCNLKCVTCSPIHSSQLIGEWEDLQLFNQKYDKKYYVKLGKQAPAKIDFIKDVLNNSDFDVLKLEIFGGEPLINPLIFRFVDWITEQKYASQVFLSITSNSTTFTPKLEEYANKFKQVALQISIDGIGETFEYLRYGTDWNESLEVINKYYEMVGRVPNFSLAFNYTLSWMNSLHFVDFYNYAQKNYPKIQLHLTKLEGPEWYSVNLLSYLQRKKLVDITLEKLEQQPITASYERLLDLYQQSMIFRNHDDFNIPLYKQGKKALEEKDNLRTMDYKKVFEPILKFIEQ